MKDLVKGIALLAVVAFSLRAYVAPEALLSPWTAVTNYLTGFVVAWALISPASILSEE